ncbi:MAG: (2Fe-2S)-binding protein [Alphaproteobacteria bacterium]|nr:(2Fe-2S)-binding protein [Alphaproteobacteria bacterium]
MRYLRADQKHSVSFTLNGAPVEGSAEPRMSLVDFLRREIGLTGTHVGCEHGVCGACTVRIDGRATRSCLIYAGQVEGQLVETVEALAGAGELNDLQQAFRRHHALQCGFCTPGILMSLSQLIDEEPDADEARVREVLSGHLCRCTGYHGIVAAALYVLAQRKGHADV